MVFDDKSWRPPDDATVKKVARFILERKAAGFYRNTEATMKQFPELFLVSRKNTRIVVNKGCAGQRCRKMLRMYEVTLGKSLPTRRSGTSCCQGRGPEYGLPIDISLAKIAEERHRAGLALNHSILRDLLIVLLHLNDKSHLMEASDDGGGGTISIKTTDNKFGLSWGVRFCERNKLPKEFSTTKANSGKISVDFEKLRECSSGGSKGSTSSTYSLHDIAPFIAEPSAFVKHKRKKTKCLVTIDKRVELPTSLIKEVIVASC